MQPNASILFTVYNKIKNMMEYTPPADPDPFILDEHRPYDDIPNEHRTSSVDRNQDHFSALVRLAKRFALFTEKVRSELASGPLTGMESIKAELAALEKQWQTLAPLIFSYQESRKQDECPISTSLQENKKALEAIYRVPRNKDIIIREIEIAGDPAAAALIVYTEGIVDGTKLDRFVLEPLMKSAFPRELYTKDPIDKLIKQIIPNGQVQRAATLKQVEEGINRGDTALLIDGVSEAVTIETKGWEHRGVNPPQTEQSIRGSQAAFSENLRVNTGLIRSILRSSDLVTELVTIGSRGQISCALMYIDSIANTSLVNEIRRRLNGIETDYIIDSGQLAQFIEDSPTVLFPQTISTERPDRVAAHLVEGRVALILEGNPFAQILPVGFFSFFHSAEDFSVKSGLANFMRVLRLFGALISTVLPSLYLAISYFHQEAIPTELLLAIAGARENVPFPAVLEVLMMEISFELIREAGIRVPGFLGSTIGIVGAIILGQAAVAARIVSPIVVVIIAITGLASFAIPEYRMASAIRLIRFVLILLAWTMGLVGLAMALLGLTVFLCRLKSFGMPYLGPVGPRTMSNFDVVIRGQVYNQETRPDQLNTKEERRQPSISRIWKRQHAAEGEDP